MEFNMVSVAVAVIVVVSAPLVYAALDLLFLMFRMWMVGRQLEGLPVLPNLHWLYGHLKEDPGPKEEGLRWSMKMAENRRVFVKWFACVPTLVICHPEPLRIVLGTRGAHEKPLTLGYKFAVPWLGYGLLFSGGQKWARSRKMLTPAFHFNILKPYVDVYNEAVEVFLDKLNAGCDQERMEIFQPVSLLTLDVVMRCAFSYQGHPQQEGVDNEYVAAVVSLSKLFMKRVFNPLVYTDLIYSLTPNGRKFKHYCDLVHSISEGIINQRIQALENDPEILNKKYRDFLDVLLTARDDENQGLSALEIRNEVDTFLFAGHDTTASALAWTLYALAKNPHCQMRCQDEIDALLKNRTSVNIQWEDLGQMPYLQMCIKEGLRMYSAVPDIGRELGLSDKPIVIEGVTLPKGLFIQLSTYLVHHNPTLWGDDHMEYKPERFLPEKMKDMDPYAFIPFSAGPRNCIGQNFAMNELKVALARILHQFTLDVDENRLPQMAPNIVMHADDGIHLKISRRH